MIIGILMPGSRGIGRDWLIRSWECISSLGLMWTRVFRLRFVVMFG